jgi:hypothetical protein
MIKCPYKSGGSVVKHDANLPSSDFVGEEKNRSPVRKCRGANMCTDALLSLANLELPKVG